MIPWILYNLSTTHACPRWRAAANQEWEYPEKICLVAAVNLYVRGTLRDALVRTTLTYALQTRDLNEQDIRKLEKFTFKCIRQIIEPRWYMRGTHIPKTHTYQRYGILVVRSRLGKLEITHRHRQTINTWNIHTRQKLTTTINDEMWQTNWQKLKKQRWNYETRAQDNKNTSTNIYTCKNEHPE